MDEYDSYNGKKRTPKRKNRSPGLRLAVCMGIVTAAVCFRFLCPGLFMRVTDLVTEKTDIESAIRVLGEGISGKRRFSEAVDEAFVYAFAPGLARDEETEPTDYLSVMSTEDMLLI